VILYAGSVIVSGLLLIAVRSRPLDLLKMVRENQPLFLRRLNRLVRILAICAWIAGVLTSLSALSAVSGLVLKMLSAKLNYGALHLSLGQVLEFVFTIWLSFQISRFLRFLLEEDIYDHFALPSGIPYAISKLLHYVVLLVGFYIALSTLNKNDLSTLNVLAGAFGVGLAFGTQNIVNNFVSGLILLFERPVKVGDVIQLDDTVGVVAHIGIRASIIRTMDSSEIIVPNGMLISNKVTNWTLSNRQRGIEIQVALAATADPKLVMELLVRVASENSMINKIPAPQAFLAKFSGDAFNYELHAWTTNADRWIQIRSDLSVALNTALVKEGIVIK
jgi:small-conductance mechanosensitive channel